MPAIYSVRGNLVTVTYGNELHVCFWTDTPWVYQATQYNPYRPLLTPIW